MKLAKRLKVKEVIILKISYLNSQNQVLNHKISLLKRFNLLKLDQNTQNINKRKAMLFLLHIQNIIQLITPI